ncbi:MAG: phage major capsid protein [Hyphomicrobiaceae bacterium]|nr:phage major capsid protein [Hyphomicrobiaceae bacterium]MCC0024623.1 phage major capsid protein [Hyphomicrobiaceae bacterium]
MNTRIKELRAKQEQITAEARERLNQIDESTDETRSKELEAQHDKAMAEYDRLEGQIQRELKVAELEAGIKAREDEARAKNRPIDPAAGPAAAPDDGEISYRDAFHEYLRAQGQLGAMRPEARAVLARGYAAVESEARAQTTSNSAGGYTVPSEVANVLIKSMAAWGPMYDPGVTTEIKTTGGGQILLPTVNDTASTGGASNGEGVTLTDDGGKDAAFGQKALGAYSFDTEWLRVSKELADDSIFAMEALLGDLLGERLGRLANSQLTVGTGSSAPNGIVTASTAGKTAASTTAITGDEIIDLVHSVDPAYRSGPKVAFMMHDLVLAAVRKLKDGDGNYLWQMGDVQKGIPASLLGHRYYVNQAMESSIAAAKKVMLFGDLSKYYVRKVGDPLIGALQDKDFWPGFGVAGWIRFDGELGDTAAVKHLITAAS